MSGPIGPGFTRPEAGEVVPAICPEGSHRFERRGVCLDCRRTVPELAALGLATPLPCSLTGIHVAVGPVCLDCEATIADDQEGAAAA
jgi:hypothetical protein